MNRVHLSLVLLMAVGFPCLQAEEITAIILPARNTGSLVYDSLGDYIAPYMLMYLKDIPGSNVIPVNAVNRYCLQSGISRDQLNRSKSLEQLADHFKADYILQGVYDVMAEKISLTLIIYSYDGESISNEYYPLTGQLQPLLNQTLDELLLPKLQQFMHTTLQFTSLDITTGTPCSLYIDGVRVGETPFRSRISAGKHNIQIMLPGEEIVIYTAEHFVDPQTTVTVELPAYINLSLTSSLSCRVYLEGEFIGTTPLTHLLPSGQIYHLKMERESDTGVIIPVLEQDISTADYRDIDLDIPATGQIKLNGPAPFMVSIDGRSYFKFPCLFTDLAPGPYTVTTGYSDGTKVLYFARAQYQLPEYSTLALDFGELDYKSRLLLSALPAAAQFYNRKKLKGAFIGICFTGGLVTTLVSRYFGERYYAEYVQAASLYHLEGISSGYTQTGLDEWELRYKKTDWLYTGALIGTIGMYLYSLIDGIYDTRHMDKIING